ncbi:MAG: serine/threonine-protein kinase [Myxococcales bacterium]
MTDWPQLDGLRIESRLASVGVTEVYYAVQETLGRRVLVKSIKPNVLPSSPFAAALAREAHLLSEISHPNIQRLYDFRRTESQMWLVLEYLDGKSLEAVLAQTKQLPPLAVAGIGLMLASALAHCHERGVMHRAVEPKNLALGKDGRAILTNFVGAVKDRLPTAPELLDGSTHLTISPYFSPEQVLGETVDARSDLFSLGLVLYQALTGHHPFASPDESRVSQRIRKEVVPPASRFAKGVPSSLERALHRCLEKMPQDRFGSAEELCRALEGILREHDVVSPEAECRLATLSVFGPGAAQPLAATKPVSTAKVSGTHPLTTGLIGLVVAALLLAGGGYAQQRMNGTENSVALKNTGRLELLPDRAGTLRIVADPWATVTVDGQPLGTTPMARPIPLQAGTHFVHLEHPRAPIERRIVRVSEGEMVLLDIKMNVAPSADPTPDPSAQGPDAGFSP